nr:hypothetical protein [Tanacetum cinerariifolium]
MRDFPGSLSFSVRNKNQSISKSDVDLKLLEHLPKFVDLDFIFFLLFLIEHPLRIRDIGVKRIRLMHNNFFKTEAWIFGQEEVQRSPSCLPSSYFTELHQLDTFYNALNPADQDSLNFAADGNLLERRTQDVLTIIENKSKCLAAGGNTFPELRDNIQGYVSAAAVNYNQGNSVYRPLGMANQIRPPGFAQSNVQNYQNRFSQPQGYNRGNNFNPEQSYQALTQQNQIVSLNELEIVKRMNEVNMKAMQTQINNVKNELRDEMKISIQASLSNQVNEIKNMMASLFQMNTASTSGSGSLPSNTKEDERVEETLTDQDLAEYTIKVPPLPVQKYKPSSQRDFVVHQRDPLHPNIPYPSRILKQKQQEKDEVQIHKFWQMFKQLHINITLADALILMPKYQKMLKALLSNKEKL